MAAFKLLSVKADISHQQHGCLQAPLSQGRHLSPATWLPSSSSQSRQTSLTSNMAAFKLLSVKADISHQQHGCLQAPLSQGRHLSPATWLPSSSSQSRQTSLTSNMAAFKLLSVKANISHQQHGCLQAPLSQGKHLSPATWLPSSSSQSRQTSLTSNMAAFKLLSVKANISHQQHGCLQAPLSQGRHDPSNMAAFKLLSVKADISHQQHDCLQAPLSQGKHLSPATWLPSSSSQSRQTSLTSNMAAFKLLSVKANISHQQHGCLQAPLSQGRHLSPATWLPSSSSQSRKTSLTSNMAAFKLLSVKADISHQQHGCLQAPLSQGRHLSPATWLPSSSSQSRQTSLTSNMAAFKLLSVKADMIPATWLPSSSSQSRQTSLTSNMAAFKLLSVKADISHQQHGCLQAPLSQGKHLSPATWLPSSSSQSRQTSLTSNMAAFKLLSVKANISYQQHGCLQAPLSQGRHMIAH